VGGRRASKPVSILEYESIARKFFFQMFSDIKKIKTFQVAETIIVKTNHNNDFHIRHGKRAISMSFTVSDSIESLVHDQKEESPHSNMESHSIKLSVHCYARKQLNRILSVSYDVILKTEVQ
jgi:hypothetical protein